MLVQCWTLSLAIPLAHAFYLPGVSPIEYPEGGQVELKVNKLTSSKTQLPYQFYTLPFCRPTEIKDKVENLGEILTGDMIENSPYEINMMVVSKCKQLCTQKLEKKSKEKFRSMIEDEYVVNWIVDNLPAATLYKYPSVDGGVEKTIYMSGFPVGSLQGGRYFVHNHVTITLSYHSNPSNYEGYRIVGFEVVPSSTSSSTCDLSTPFDLDAHDEIPYTYDVNWVVSDVRWASRWDLYLNMTNSSIHWFSILNSVMIVVFLSALVAMIMLRTVHRDIAKYNEIVSEEEAAEETGWKLVHGDVFRKPRWSKMLAVSVGSGLQTLGMAVATLFFAVLGFVSPAHRGGLLGSMMVLFSFMGIVAGYASARIIKLFKPDDADPVWKTTAIMTAFLYPGIIFSIFFTLNLFIWGQKSSGAVPFLTMFALLTLWFGISVPLNIAGAYFGNKQKAIELPVRTNPLPRRIPTLPAYQHPLVRCLAGGVLPFGAIFTELFFIMSSLWHHQFYYLFGFLALVLLVLLVTCAEISVTLTYFQLTAEDYSWWWNSFFASASTGLYVFGYSIFYFSLRLNITKVVSCMLYFGYMSIISMLFSLITGSVGIIASFFFVRAIYASIKVE